MKNIKAIGVAFVLFLVTVAGLKIVARNTMPVECKTNFWFAFSIFILQN